MAEIFCKRCFHHEELGRPVKPGEPCPSCAAPGVFRRVKRVGPATHFPSVLRAIFSLRGVFSLAAFALVGKVPIGALAAASILLLYLGGLRLALKGMSMGKDGIDFPEISPEELLPRSDVRTRLVLRPAPGGAGADQRSGDPVAEDWSHPFRGETTFVTHPSTSTPPQTDSPKRVQRPRLAREELDRLRVRDPLQTIVYLTSVGAGILLAAVAQFIRQSRDTTQPASVDEPFSAKSRRELVGLVSAQICILAAFWTAGHAVAYFAACLLPLVTLTRTLTHLRNMARHVQLRDVGDPELSRYRTTHVGLIERFFAPMNFNYHAEHHFYPMIPWHDLPEAHRVLSRRAEYANVVEVERGVLRFILGKAVQPSRLA